MTDHSYSSHNVILSLLQAIKAVKRSIVQLEREMNLRLDAVETSVTEIRYGWKGQAQVRSLACHHSSIHRRNCVIWDRQNVPVDECAGYHRV